MTSMYVALQQAATYQKKLTLDVRFDYTVQWNAKFIGEPPLAGNQRHSVY